MKVNFDDIFKNVPLEKIKIPNPIPKGFVQYLIEKKGMISKKELEDGVKYYGICRNVREAVWNAEKQKFIYERRKFGNIFNERINHPEDDNGFDLFIPIKKIKN